MHAIETEQLTNEVLLGATDIAGHAPQQVDGHVDR